jgi:predicted small integral membrane protein
MIRTLKILFAAIVAYWGLIGAMGNFASLSIAYDYVEMVTSMSGVVDAGAAAPPWRTSSPVIVWAGVLLIVLGKLGAAVFCSLGVFKMLRARNADRQEFARARQWAVLGCGLAVAMLFGGFIVIGETMYLMWVAPDGEHAAAGAFRYGGFIALIMIFIAQAEPEGT